MIRRRPAFFWGFAAFTAVALITMSPGGSAWSSPAPEISTFESFGFIPEDALFAGGARMEDLGAVWDKWMGLFDKFQTEEEKAEMKAGLEKARAELGFDIRKDFLPLFEGEILPTNPPHPQ